MTIFQKRCIAFLGTATLLAFALPAAHAQAVPDPNAPATPAPATPTPDTPTPDTAAPPAPTPATPQAVPDNSGPPPSSRFRIGPAVGLYLPSSGKTRDRFGDDWVSFGIGLGAINAISTKGSVGFDASIFYHGRDSNHAFFLPIGISYRIALAPGTNVVPYAGVSADVDFTDITSNPDNIHNSFNVGGGGSGFVGLNFGDSAFVEARYYGLSKARGFDLSGLSFSTGYRF